MNGDSFYNTINLEGRQLSEAQRKAFSQEQNALRYFIAIGSGNSAAPSKVLAECFGYQVPLTSVRRAITNLTARGDLLKLGAMIMGTYGKPEHLWTVAAKWDATKPHQGELL